MLDLQRLNVLHRFSLLGSITAVAADMGYSPSAVSQQLSTLEREAGLALLERTARSATLTDAGRELARFAATALDTVEAATSRMRERAGMVSGVVEVSCVPSLAVQLAPELAAEQLRHADLTVVAREGGSVDAEASVLDGRCDLAIVDDWSGGRGPAAAGLAVHLLRQETILLAVPTDHPEARRTAPLSRSRFAEIVEDQTWLCAPEGQLSRSGGDQRLAALDVVPNRRWEFQGLHVLAALVAAGSGLAFLPDSILAQQSGVRGLSLRPVLRRYVLAITRTSRGPDPALAACLDAAVRALGTGAPRSG